MPKIGPQRHGPLAGLVRHATGRMATSSTRAGGAFSESDGTSGFSPSV